jgi:hypothetical protein
MLINWMLVPAGSLGYHFENNGYSTIECNKHLFADINSIPPSACPAMMGVPLRQVYPEFTPSITRGLSNGSGQTLWRTRKPGKFPASREAIIYYGSKIRRRYMTMPLAAGRFILSLILKALIFLFEQILQPAFCKNRLRFPIFLH